MNEIVRKHFIIDLRDKYLGEEIWIIGTGKSLDDFPKDFFKNKISIALNGAIYKYPDSTFWLSFHEHWMNKALKENPNIFKKTIIPYFYENYNKEGGSLLGNMSDVPFWIFLPPIKIKNERVMEEGIEKSIHSIVSKDSKMFFIEHGTVAHSGISSACVMGAKKITMVGCEHKSYPNQNRYAELGTIYPTPKKINSWIEPDNLIEYSTIFFAKTLKKYNIELMRYYNADTNFYKKGYEKIG